MNLSSYIKIQKILLTIFFLSVAVMFLVAILTANIFQSGYNANTGGNTSTNSSGNSGTPPVGNGGGSSGLTLAVIGGVTFLTSLTSLLGFISTTVLAWRKEKRDVETIRIENEKKELELMKLRMEIEEIKAEQKTPKKRAPGAAARKPKKPDQ